METTQDISTALTSLMNALERGDPIEQQVALVAVVADVFTDIKRAASALETISKFELARVGELVYGAAMTKEKDDATNAIAAWILANVDGEPSRSEGAIETMARLLASGNVALLKLDEIETLTALRFGSLKLVPVSLNERAGVTPSIVGIPDNAPFGPGPGGITPADKRFVPWRAHDAEMMTSYRPEIDGDAMVMWHDGENVHGPDRARYLAWSPGGNPMEVTIKAYFVVD